MAESASPCIEEIVRLAEEYCALLESANTLESKSLLVHVAFCLSRLCGAGFQIPPVQPATDELGGVITSEAQESIQAWESIHQILRPKLASFNSYWTIDEPTEKSEPYENSLSNDLAEIYQDLKEELALSRSGADPADIQWSWREGFNHHWGNHALDALKAIYWRIFQYS